MSDVVVTVPKSVWRAWLREGDLAGQAWGHGDAGQDGEYYFSVSSVPQIKPDERVYIVAYGKLRGYAPLVRVERRGRPALVRRGDAVAVTIPRAIPGFQGYRYRWWRREDEVAFPNWMKP